MTYDNGLFIFHRDLRIFDNIGLIEGSSMCKNLYVCFIFTPEQITDKNKYKSDNAVEFMFECLYDLDFQIKKKTKGELLIFYGNQNEIIQNCIDKLNIDCVIFNKDYTPYAIERDYNSYRLCEKNKITCVSFSDYYLYNPETILSSSNDAYKKFTPFYEHVLHKSVDEPNHKQVNNIVKTNKNIDHLTTLNKCYKLFTNDSKNKYIFYGGREHGLIKLNKSLKNLNDYENTRDYLNTNTSELSSYIKFGCISIREVYDKFKNKYGLKNEFIRQLIWRDFYAHLLYKYPSTINKSYRYTNITWNINVNMFNKWCKGETGFPMVDACMRQLNTTGYMHNRGRMVVANFLTKTLLIDWRKGAKYFANKLVDYDPASNSGNWQNISSTGVYYTPYFRDMNPYIQSKKFDENCDFIKKWIPELKNVDSDDIHQWYNKCNEEKYVNVKYPHPIVDYKEQKEKMTELYNTA